jgi:hypothetical protein
MLGIRAWPLLCAMLGAALSSEATQPPSRTVTVPEKPPEGPFVQTFTPEHWGAVQKFVHFAPWTYEFSKA